jgi:hypothetical protein
MAFGELLPRRVVCGCAVRLTLPMSKLYGVGAASVASGTETIDAVEAL